MMKIHLSASRKSGLLAYIHHHDVDLDAIDYNLPWLNKCETCNKTYVNRSGLLAHQRRAHFQNRPIFLCALCGKKYLTKKGLSLHVLTIHIHHEEKSTEPKTKNPNAYCVKKDGFCVPVLPVPVERREAASQ